MTASKGMPRRGAVDSVIERLESLGAVLEDYRDPRGEDPDGQVVVHLRDWRGSRSELDFLGRIPRVTSLLIDASHSRLRDGDVERIVGIPALEVLNLSWTEITGAAISHLPRARGLIELCLRETEIGDADLEPIGELNRLWRLDLSRTRVSGQLVAIPESVADLMLTESPLEKLVLASEVSRPTLTCLRLGGTPITDAMLNEVEKCPNVSSLLLERTRVTDVGLSVVGRISKLQMLLLDCDDITDTGLERIHGLNNLRHLSLSFTKITDRGLDVLAGLRELESVIVSGSAVTAEGFERLESRLGRALEGCLGRLGFIKR